MSEWGTSKSVEVNTHPAHETPIPQAIERIRRQVLKGLCSQIKLDEQDGKHDEDLHGRGDDAPWPTVQRATDVSQRLDAVVFLLLSLGPLDDVVGELRHQEVDAQPPQLNDQSETPAQSGVRERQRDHGAADLKRILRDRHTPGGKFRAASLGQRRHASLHRGRHGRDGPDGSSGRCHLSGRSVLPVLFHHGFVITTVIGI